MFRRYWLKYDWGRGTDPLLATRELGSNFSAMTKRKEGAAAFINVDRSRMNPVDLRARLAERDMRQLTDTRTEAQKWLGDPPPMQSAMAQGSGQAPRRSAGRGQRVDLWKK